MNGILALLALVLVATTTQKKEDQVLMEVGKEEVTVSEFTNVFKKNNNLQEVTNQELEDYVDLFVKFKMKVLDAERMQLDTFSSFKNELAGYENN